MLGALVNNFYNIQLIEQDVMGSVVLMERSLLFQGEQDALVGGVCYCKLIARRLN